MFAGNRGKRLCKHKEVGTGALAEVISYCSVLWCGYFEILVLHGIIIIVQLVLL